MFLKIKHQQRTQQDDQAQKNQVCRYLRNSLVLMLWFGQEVGEDVNGHEDCYDCHEAKKGEGGVGEWDCLEFRTEGGPG